MTTKIAPVTWKARLLWLARPAVWVLAGLVTLLCLLLLAGTVRDDLAIGANPQRTVAQVLSVSDTRTVVRFTTPDGTVHIPPQGVLYPGGLDKGDRVWVQYDTRNTDLVKIANRGFTVALLPLGIIVLVTWLIAGPLLWWLHLRRERHG